MTEILLARHGETDWNREGRFQGHADPPLNEAGRAQARALAERLAEVELDAIYSSDLRRARETAEIVAAAKGLTVTTDPGLREVDVGSWSGLTRGEIADRFPDAEQHDGESAEEHLARVLAAVDRIARAHTGGRILIVSHGGSLRRLHTHALGEPVEALPNGALYTLRHGEDGFRRID